MQDACQAHGLRIEGRPLSDYSPYVAYSFYPTKNLGGIGDGGAVVTSSEDVAEHIRLLRDGGRDGAYSPPRSHRGGASFEEKAIVSARDTTMPVYEYMCDACGPFTDLRPMSEYEEPQPCPSCETSSPRVLLTAPNFSCMPAALASTISSMSASVIGVLSSIMPWGMICTPWFNNQRCRK